MYRTIHKLNVTLASSVLVQIRCCDLKTNWSNEIIQRCECSNNFCQTQVVASLIVVSIQPTFSNGADLETRSNGKSDIFWEHCFARRRRQPTHLKIRDLTSVIPQIIKKSRLTNMIQCKTFPTMTCKQIRVANYERRKQRHFGKNQRMFEIDGVRHARNSTTNTNNAFIINEWRKLLQIEQDGVKRGLH